MNDWGIPNWTSGENYIGSDSWNELRWRWEFLRRRHDLREYFLANADRSYQLAVETASISKSKHNKRILRPDEPGFTVSIFDGREDLGYIAIPNPAISEQPDHVLTPFPIPGPRYVEGDGDRYFGDGVTISCGDGEAALVFDLSLPIGPQLERAKETLQSLQELRHGQRLQTRQRRELWLQYLRALDAYETGASLSQIKSFIRAGKNEQAARDALSAAKRLRDNF